jgi:hypothetical protein
MAGRFGMLATMRSASWLGVVSLGFGSAGILPSSSSTCSVLKMWSNEGKETEHKERTMKKLLLIAGLCVPRMAFAQTYRLNVYPNSPDLSNPLGSPRIVTSTDYVNTLANYNNSLAFQNYLRQQQMYQARPADSQCSGHHRRTQKTEGTRAARGAEPKHPCFPTLEWITQRRGPCKYLCSIRETSPRYRCSLAQWRLLEKTLIR